MRESVCVNEGGFYSIGRGDFSVIDGQESTECAASSEGRILLLQEEDDENSRILLVDECFSSVVYEQKSMQMRRR